MNSKDKTGPHQFNMPAWIRCAPFEQLLGMNIEKADAGEAILTMPFVRSLAQGAGLMHGGALVSLADTAVVMAIKSVVSPGTHFATVTMENRFLHPVTKGVLEARARVVEHQGCQLKGTCDVFDETDRKVMVFKSVFKIAHHAEIRNVSYGTDSHA